MYEEKVCTELCYNTLKMLEDSLWNKPLFF